MTIHLNTDSILMDKWSTFCFKQGFKPLGYGTGRYTDTVIKDRLHLNAISSVLVV